MTRAQWLRLLLIVFAVAALELACRVGKLSPISIVPPSEMVMSAIAIIASGKASHDIMFSLWNVGMAVVLSVGGGFALGVLLHGMPRLRGAFEPMLSAYYAVPTFVLYPILVIVFGLGSGPLIAMGSLFGIVAMVINTLAGLDSVPRALLDTAAAFRLGRITSLLRIRVPAAMLHLTAGVRLAVAYSIIGIVAGEFILSTQGVGKRIAFAYNDFDTKGMYGLLVLLLTFVIAVNGLIQQAENRLRRRWSA